MVNEEVEVLHRERLKAIGTLAPSALGVSSVSSGWATLPLRSLGVIMLITLAFAGIALTISLVFGMPFTFPVSGDIPGLHVNYWIPPLAAAISYLLLQFFGAQLSSEKRHWRDVVRHAADDYLLLGLFIVVICLHFNMKMWVPAVNSRLYDQEYFAIDQALQPVLDAVFFIRNTIS